MSDENLASAARPLFYPAQVKPIAANVQQGDRRSKTAPENADRLQSKARYLVAEGSRLAESVRLGKTVQALPMNEENRWILSCWADKSVSGCIDFFRVCQQWEAQGKSAEVLLDRIGEMVQLDWLNVCQNNQSCPAFWLTSKGARQLQASNDDEIDPSQTQNSARRLAAVSRQPLAGVLGRVSYRNINRPKAKNKIASTQTMNIAIAATFCAALLGIASSVI